MWKRSLLYLMVLSFALALWDLMLGDLYYGWAEGQEPLASTTIGTVALGYFMVLLLASSLVWFMTRRSKDANR